MANQFSINQKILVYLLPIGTLFCLSYPALAQKAPLTPDTSLPTEIKIEGNKIFIEGGKETGSHLFHSFQEFSIPSNTEAIFQNGLDISDIFVRVTGNSLSNLEGILTAQGNANFWLLNPNGIILGENFQLNVGGSFLATTGNSIEFADGTEFRANRTEARITQSAPLGINFPSGQAPAPILIKDTGHNLKDFSFLGQLSKGRNPEAGLQVNRGRNFTLLANQITLDGGLITAEGGQIDIAAVERGKIAINPDLTVNFDQSINNQTDFSDISLTNKALLDVSSPSSSTASGGVQLLGENINLSTNSVILSQNQASTPGGEISVKAVESVSLTGLRDRMKTGIYSESAGQQKEGIGSNINISAPNININNSTVRSTSISKSSGGAINLTGSNLELTNIGLVVSTTTNTGQAGDIQANFSETIELRETTTSSGSQEISAGFGNFNFGFGSNGKLEVSSETIIVSNGAAIVSQIFPEALAKIVNPFLKINGQSNDVTITAKTLAIGGSNLSQIFRVGRQDNEIFKEETAESTRFSTVGTSTLSSVAAGDVNLNVNELIITDRGQISSFSQSSGNAGQINVNAAEFITLDNGKILASVEAPRQIAQKLFNLFGPTGKPQQVTIETPQLTMTNGSEITVSNDGDLEAGILKIDADFIQLDDSQLTATTSAGQGKIQIQSDDFRLFSSEITTSAQKKGNGGDINIQSDIFLSDKGSNIIATAVRGNGGNILITGESGVLISADTTISADSQFGIDGEVRIEGLSENKIGNELSIVSAKFNEEQPQTTSQYLSCNRQNQLNPTDIQGINFPTNQYQNPYSPLWGFTPPPQRPQKIDNEFLEQLASTIIMANAPEDESKFVEYLQENYEEVKVLGEGQIVQVFGIKNRDKILQENYPNIREIPANLPECN